MGKNDKINLLMGVIKKDFLVTNNWTGGTTTQLLIYPEDGNYVTRNFRWRVSTASVEVQESTFTSLPGISRIIMILKGCLKIEHNEHNSVELKPYEAYSFKGEWVTKSFGKVTDFNLMMGDGVAGELDSIKILPMQKQVFSIIEDIKNYENITYFYYCPFKNIGIMINDKEYRLNAGDLMYITDVKIEMKLEFINDCDDDIIVVIGKVLH